eukprot:2846126-Prymnesium_polylepis.1
MIWSRALLPRKIDFSSAGMSAQGVAHPRAARNRATATAVRGVKCGSLRRSAPAMRVLSSRTLCHTNGRPALVVCIWQQEPFIRDNRAILRNPLLHERAIVPAS